MANILSQKHFQKKNFHKFCVKNIQKIVIKYTKNFVVKYICVKNSNVFVLK